MNKRGVSFKAEFLQGGMSGRQQLQYRLDDSSKAEGTTRPSCYSAFMTDVCIHQLANTNNKYII